MKYEPGDMVIGDENAVHVRFTRQENAIVFPLVLLGWKAGTPPRDVWCWVTDGDTAWPAYHDGKTWTNGDTWEDTTEQRVTGWYPMSKHPEISS